MVKVTGTDWVKPPAENWMVPLQTPAGRLEGFAETVIGVDVPPTYPELGLTVSHVVCAQLLCTACAV